MKNIHIAVLMMVKNEKKRLHVSLESVKDFADSLIIYDTGSTDNTVQICKDFSEKYNIPLRLKEGEFINFAESRNISLDFADSFEDVDFLLLMDTNDELVNGHLLRNFAKEHKDAKNETAFLISQEWFSGKLDKYYNVRFIKAREGWRYVGVVHEYMKTYKPENEGENMVKIDGNIKLYQDRTQDDDKTGKRFYRDKDLLLAEYEKDPTEPRTVFYLAQTFSCINDYENAYKYSKIRLELVGFWEEVFQSYLRCGEYSENLKMDWYESMTWYMKAFEHTERVEPLLKIAEYYQKKEKWLIAYNFLQLACRLKFPEHCILFVDNLAYEYRRWHIMGIVAYYIQEYNVGKNACSTAIENGKKININVDRDIKNLEFYINKERELLNNNIPSVNNINNPINNPSITKNEFMRLKVEELKRENPKSTSKQLQQLAKILWKNRKV
jgi:glycosyltransferase involved in cell wall biosynthesis